MTELESMKKSEEAFCRTNENCQEWLKFFIKRCTPEDYEIIFETVDISYIRIVLDYFKDNSIYSFMSFATFLIKKYIQKMEEIKEKKDEKNTCTREGQWFECCVFRCVRYELFELLFKHINFERGMGLVLGECGALQCESKGSIREGRDKFFKSLHKYYMDGLRERDRLANTINSFEICLRQKEEEMKNSS